MNRVALLLAALALAGCGASGTGLEPSLGTDLGALVVGDVAQSTVFGPLVGPDDALVADPSSLTVEVADRETGALRVRWRPEVPGPLAGAVVVLDPLGEVRARWAFTGTARAPRMEVHPNRIRYPADAEGPLAFVVVEGSPALALTLVGAPDAELVTATRPGLPLRVRLPAEAPVDAIALRVAACPHPDCTVDVPIEVAEAESPCVPAQLVFEAVPVTETAVRRLDCPSGVPADLRIPPELRAVTLDSTSVEVAWTPTAPGFLQVELQAGEARWPVLGYAVEAAPCDVRVSEAAQLGAVGLGGHADGRIWVENRGPTPCLFSGLDVEGGAFSARPLAPAFIPPGEAAAAGVRFAPDALGPHEGSAIPRLAGPDDARTPLFGEGVTADLLVRTPRIDLGTFNACNSASVPLVVANEGGVTGTVQVVETRGSRVTIDRSRHRVGPGEVLRLIPQPNPRGESTAFEATIVLELRAPGRTWATEVTVVGERGASPRAEDTFEQIGRPKVDMLLVIDDGPAMFDRRPVLAENIERFAEFTVAQGLDARLGVIRASMDRPEVAGRLLPLEAPAVLTSTAPGFGEAVVGLVLDAAGTVSGTTSPGLQAALTAVTSTATGRPAGWPRPDAALSIMAFSARDDESPRTTSYYINEFYRLKGYRNTNLFSFSAVAGDVPDGCVDDTFVAEAATHYLEVANRTGGVFQSVCARQWSRRLENLGIGAFGFKSRFFLTNQPIQETLEVEVDGEIVPRLDADGRRLWTYDFGTNSINFSPFGVPERGTTIVVRYEPECL